MLPGDQNLLYFVRTFETFGGPDLLVANFSRAATVNDNSKAFSAVDNIHEIARRIAEEETPKSPLFPYWPINNFCSCRANSSLGSIKIVYAD